MPSGGARARSGPAPDPNALRRDRKDDAEWISLPAAGRTDPAPVWPLTEASEREMVLWEREWRRPQALMWEKNGQEAEVAVYVRAFADAEQVGASVAARTLLRQLQETLGVSLPGLARNRWRIVHEDVKETRKTAAPSSRSRFKVVPNDGA